MRKILLLTILVSFLMAGYCWAVPFNQGRPLELGSSNEPSLQNIFDDVFGEGSIDAIKDQSNVAIWQEAEADVDAYLVTMFTSNSSNLKLGIYSYVNPSLYYTFNFNSNNPTVDFNITNAGNLRVDDDVVTGFGNYFGFYIDINGTKFYTEDDKNGRARALTYLVSSGLVADLTEYAYDDEITLSGNNDWILAFEDWNDNDYQDAIFLIEDMQQPVPEPATMLLLGSGLVGLAGFGRKKFFKKG